MATGDGDIDEVIARLGTVVDTAVKQASPLGYFAAVYRKVTQQIRDALGGFDDRELIERLDVAFAQRYLDAHDAYTAGRRPTSAWAVAFAAAQQRDVVVMQHLLLGMNAHIRLDLGVSAAAVADELGKGLGALRSDFEKVNDVLQQTLPLERNAIERVSPGVRLLDRCRRLDVDIADAWLRDLRSRAWELATSLAGSTGEVREQRIAAADGRATVEAHRVLHPHLMERFLDRQVIERFEDHDVRRVITALAA